MKLAALLETWWKGETPTAKPAEVDCPTLQFLDYAVVIKGTDTPFDPDKEGSKYGPIVNPDSTRIIHDPLNWWRDSQWFKDEIAGKMSIWRQTAKRLCAWK